MLRERRRRVALDQGRQPCQVRFVEFAFGADRPPHAVQRERVVGPDASRPARERPTGHEVVLGVDLEEAGRRVGGEHVPEMPGLQAEADAGHGGPG